MTICAANTEPKRYAFMIKVAQSFTEPGRGGRRGIRRALAHQSTKKKATQLRKTPDACALKVNLQVP
jgi:hypothetical protein